MKRKNTVIAGALRDNSGTILEKWRQLVELEARGAREIFDGDELESVLGGIYEGVLATIEEGGDTRSHSYDNLLGVLEHLSTEATLNSVSPSEIARFVFSLKDCIHESLPGALPADALAESILLVNNIIDRLGLFTFETYVRSREAVIKEQQKAILEVSVPVVKVWDKILMLPLIGMIDSSRTQIMMETLLGAIEDTQSRVTILDISGIPIVDSLVARHLIMTAAAARLMGAECIITGISSRISQTMVNLGVDLRGVLTRSSLADGLRLALDLTEQKFA